MRTGDVGREAVYAAEQAAFGGTDLDDPRGLAELVEAADRVTGGAWWQSCGGPAVTVTAARAGVRSSSAWPTAASAVTIRVAAGQASVATLAHELGHALAGVAGGHGGRFRAAHVDAVAVLAGIGPATMLRDAYVALDVPPAPPPWPSPVWVTGAGFAVVRRPSRRRPPLAGTERASDRR